MPGSKNIFSEGNKSIKSNIQAIEASHNMDIVYLSHPSFITF